jgi:futalosine hydrolase
MKILLVAATPFEIAPTLEALNGGPLAAPLPAFSRYALSNRELSVLITGVGLPLAAFSLATVLARDRFDQAIQAGVGGAIDPALPLESVVEVISERFADLGAEAADGRFIPVAELGLIPPDMPPFQGGALLNSSPLTRHPQVQGISVNRVHGFAPSIEALRAAWPNAQLESMEGAAFFYACLQHNLPCCQLRAVSNYVEPRNRAGWRLEGAIQALNEALKEVVF